MTTIYGIKNCDTIKKAKLWLDEHKIEYHFHDYRKDGLDEAQLKKWCDELGWENLLNKRGTTWRKLTDEIKENINQSQAIKIMLEQPAIIKRPLLEKGKIKKLGFSAKEYSDIFK